MSCIEGMCIKDGSTWKRYDRVGTGDYYTLDYCSEIRRKDAAGRLWIAEGKLFRRAGGDYLDRVPV